MVAHIDRTTARGSRDAALILLGFASALRRSELAGLELADVEPKPEGLLIRVRKSKTNPEARGQLVGVAHGSHAETDPVTALDAWLGRRGTDPGPLFLGFRYDCIGTRPFTGSGLARKLKERAAAASIPSEHQRTLAARRPRHDRRPSRRRPRPHSRSDSAHAHLHPR